MKRQSKILPIIHLFFPIFFIGVLLVVGIPVGTYHYFARDLQSQESLMNRNETGLTLYDNNGEVFFKFYEAKSIDEIPIEAVPTHTQNAVIAIEDKDFYIHRGYSIPGIVRSFFANLRENNITQGGSTITQQLVKNALLTPEKSYLRKYQEVVLAQEIERRYTKKQILQMYFNSVYFGEGAFGIEQAAHTYFNKSASDLTIAESAILAGILPAPSALSPVSGDFEGANERQKLVLQGMRSEGYLSDTEYEVALSEKLVFNQELTDVNAIAPHFALLVRQRLIERYGEEQVIRQGLKVQTTLDRDLQNFAFNAAKKQVSAISSQNVSNASVVVIDAESREVKALVGSIDWSNEEFGKVNVAIMPRQPGSSFKPFVYAKAMEEGLITPATILNDKKTVFAGGYSPQNYDRKFRGNVTVRQALANSLNIPAVEVMSRIGVESGLEIARRLGIYSLRESVYYGPSLVLGTGEVSLLEMTNAYATFAAGGEYQDAYLVESIDDKYGNSIYEHQVEPQQVLSREVAFQITSILSDNISRQEVFGNTLSVSVPAAVKTGTTDEYKDSWTLGYTPKIAVGVWVGNNDNASMEQIAGSLGAAPIWRSIIEYVSHEDTSNFTQPTGIIKVRVCPNGLRVPPNAPANFGRTEFFRQGTAPTTMCTYTPPNNRKKEDTEKKDENSQITPQEKPKEEKNNENDT